MRFLLRLTLLIGIFGGAGHAWAQFKEDQPSDVKLGETKTVQWRAGTEVTASGGPCKRIYGYVPVPRDWPEQQVSIVKEDVSPVAKINYRTLNDETKLMEIRIPLLPSGEQAHAVVTFEICRREILPPEKTEDYVLPKLKKAPHSVRLSLLPSPQIESRNPKIRSLAKEIVGKEETAWKQVQAIYDWVREHVKFQKGVRHGAAAALKSGRGDHEDITSLFIALCRAADVPARTVWTPDHCYPEFYLEDKDGQGRWFPCQSTGKKEFGVVSDLQPILQKGDNFAPPHNPRDRQRFLAEYLTGANPPRSGKPRNHFVRQLVK